MALKDIFVEQLTADTGTFDAYFQATQVDRKEKKDGQAYLSLKLRDRTGEVSANLWTIPDGFTCQAGDFLKVRAETGTYRDALQLKLKLVKVVDRAEVEIEDFLPASKHDREDMFIGLCGITGHISNRALGDVVYDMCKDHKQQLRDAPAARKLHQAYLGGLLEHTLNLCRLVFKVCEVYPELDRDVLLAGMIVHDIGKIHEMTYTDSIGTSRTGNLLGHIIQGSILWHQYTGQPTAPGYELDSAIKDHVAHIIASHHGIKEWGAAVLPQTREAQVAHLLDMIDSRMAIINESLASQPVDGDGFTPKVYALETQLWNGGPA